MTEPYRAIPMEDIIASWPKERQDRITQRVRELIAEDEAARMAEARQPEAVRSKRLPVKVSGPA